MIEDALAVFWSTVVWSCSLVSAFLCTGRCNFVQVLCHGFVDGSLLFLWGFEQRARARIGLLFPGVMLLFVSIAHVLC